MLFHLANPWILARLVLGAAAALLATAAAAGAVGVLARYRADAPPDERTLMLERRSELIAATLQLAFVLELGAALLTTLASDRLSGSIRGAMCAWGVVDSSAYGPAALRASLLAAAGCAAWLGVRRVDARLRRGSLVRTLAAVALLVTALVYADLALGAAYFLSLDLDVVATCCSVFVDAPGRAAAGTREAGARMHELALGGAAGVAAALAGALLARRATVARALWVAALGLAGGVAAARAVVDVVAPYAYEAPHHRCAYCLLHREAGVAGPLLLGALLAATLLAAAALAVAATARREGARAAALDVLRRVGRASAVAWTLVLLAGAWPIVRYGAVTGTFALFR